MLDEQMQSVEEPTRDIYGAQGRDPWPGAGCKEGTALMEVLLVTNLWPRGGTHTFTGVFVREQVKAICRAYPDIHYDLLVIRGQENKLNYLIAPFRVYNAMRRKKYDLLHAHYGLSAVGAVFRGRTPLLVTLHGSDVMSPGFPARLSKWGTLRWADGIIVVSAEMKQLLGREDAAVVPMGVDLEMFRPMDQAQARKAIGLPEGPRYVLFASDPARSLKRYDLFLEAMALLRASDPSVEPFVLSEPRPYEHMPAIMNACDVLALTSDREGSPMVIKEAMACNLPIVSVPVGDVPDQISRVPGCFLVERSPAAITEGIRRALDYRGRVGGREAVMHLGQDMIAARVVGLYRGLISQTTGAVS